MNLPPGILKSPFVQGLDVRAPNGSMAPSDSRQIAAFFLGWVFFYSILCMWQSRFIVDLTRRITHKVFPVAPGVDVEKLEAIVASKPAVSYADIYPPNMPIRGDNPTVLFSMYLCFAIAGLAHFGSLVTFNANAGDAGCAFLVAWGTMASELAKVIALSVIGLELRQLGVNRKELLGFWVTIAIIIAFAFATTGVATGFLTDVRSTGVAFCNRKHFLPTSLTTSLLEFALAFYAVIRLITCLTSENFNVPSSISSIRDIRIIQVLAFLFFVLVTLVPSAVLTNILGDFIPFSIGSLFVLAAFSFTADPLDDKETVAPGRTVERSFSTRRGQAHPNLLGVYVPSLSSLRVSPLDNADRPDMSDHPFAKASPGPMLNRNMSEKSDVSLISRWEYPQSLIQTGRAEENVSFPSKRNTRHTLVKTQRATPEATPTPSVASSVADVGEQPWRNSMWLTRMSNARTNQIAQPSAPAKPAVDNSLKILPSQVEYAARLEQEDAERERKLAMGPVPPPVRPDRPRVQIPGSSAGGLLAPADQSRRESMTPNSAAVYGSDIVRLPSGHGRNRMRKHVSWSPQSPDMADPESAISMNPSRPRYSLTSTLDVMTTTHGSEDSLDGGRNFTTPPRARRPTFGSDAAPSIFTPSLSTGRTLGPGWRRPSAASVFSQDPLPGGFNVTSPEGNASAGRANVGLPGGLVAAPRVSIIRGPRPPPATYQPNSTLRGVPMLGSVREETSTPTKDMIERE